MKKKAKAIWILMLALLMALTINVTASASDDSAETKYTITVKNTNKALSMAGSEYAALKVFDVTYSGDHYAYTVTDEFKNYEYSYTTTVDGKEVTKTVSGDDLIAYVGTLNSEDDAEALEAFAADVYAYICKWSFDPSAYIEVEEDDTTETVQMDVTRTGAGYYMIVGWVTISGVSDQHVYTACALTTTDPTAEVEVKADVPSVEKKIVENDSLVSTNTAGIGETVSYKISSSVPNMTGYKHYYFIMNDTLSKGLTYNEDLVVTVNGVKMVKDQDYTVTVGAYSETKGTALKIVFKNFIQFKKNSGAPVEVTYSVTMNQNAVIGGDGNANSVSLTYSTDLTDEGEGEDEPEYDDEVSTTPESIVKTFATGLKLTKLGGEDPENTLTGAKFQISGEKLNLALINGTIYKVDNTSGNFWMLKDGTYTDKNPETVTDAAEKAKYDSVTTKYTQVTTVDETTTKEDFNATGYVNENGVLTIQGLAAGTYTIEELVAPDGYNLLKDKLIIKIEGGLDQTTQTCNWTAKIVFNVDGKEKKVEIDKVEDNLFSFYVINDSGTILPTTGGIGTAIFYVLGTALVLGAGVILITRKRMSRAA